MDFNAVFADDRQPHWVRKNHQVRIPKRWIAFDTEATARFENGTEIQEWSTGTAIRWRRDLKTGDHAESGTFDSPWDMWQWIADHCKPGTRTVAVAHNLGYDVRISNVFELLPKLGFELEWCNLDGNVSSMTWRSDHGTLVLADLWTWLPVPLSSVAPMVGTDKLIMPASNAPKWQWEKYCAHDTHIVYRAMSELLDYVDGNQLGNWQPTGAGMAYATWRHKFMSHKILVHDDIDAISAERSAMHTGRAEAWKHGTLRGDLWTEVDMRNAYVTIASEVELPARLKFKSGRISESQYRKLQQSYRVLAKCDITTDVECVPYYNGSRTIWPVGTFTSWLWDTEIDCAISEGATIRITESYCYAKAPILQDWAKWVLDSLTPDNEIDPATVRTWKKHSGRALIGRLSLRCPRWEHYGNNPMRETGISRTIDGDTGKERRMMHVGDKTFMETAKVEGGDSLPQVTGYIMAVCRVRLWEAMRTAGLDQVAHVDTDGLLVSRAGLAALTAAWGAELDARWKVKATYRKLVVHGPRNYRCDTLRKVSGVPRKADEIETNKFTGEKWHSLAYDMEHNEPGKVTISQGEWNVKTHDPRRVDAPGDQCATMPMRLG